MTKCCLTILLGLLLCSTSYEPQLKSGIQRKGMDDSVRPQDDLFLAANGEWIKHTPIPAEKATYGGFEILGDLSQQHVLEIFEEVTTQDYPAGSEEQKIGDFFKSYMNESRVEQLGIQPLEGELAKIDAIESTADLIQHWGYLQTIGVSSPIGFYVDQDDKQSDQHLAVIIQSGLSLPDRDFYLEDSEKFTNARSALREYVQTLFHLAELENDPELGQQILDLEKSIAEHHWPRTELRNADKRYNKKTVAELQEFAPQIDWLGFFQQSGAAEISRTSTWLPLATSRRCRK